MGRAHIMFDLLASYPPRQQCFSSILSNIVAFGFLRFARRNDKMRDGVSA